jgi:hypothetical protein
MMGCIPGNGTGLFGISNHPPSTFSLLCPIKKTLLQNLIKQSMQLNQKKN